MENPVKIRQVLAHFTGTDTWYTHALTGQIYTEGVKYLCDACEGYWLLDKILCNGKYEESLKNKPFKVWLFKLSDKDDSATLTCEDGDGNQIYQEHIEFTDYPLSSIELWHIDNTVLLPNEY